MIYLIFMAIFGLNAQAANLNCQMSLGIGGDPIEGTKILFNPIEKTLTYVLVAKDSTVADLESPIVSDSQVSALKINKLDTRCSMYETEDSSDYKMTFICKDYEEYSEINIVLDYSKTSGFGYYSELRFKKSHFGSDYKEIQIPFTNCK